MELRHLRYFQAVAEQLNFSRAAERLHVAQPALSRQIRDLEAEIGARLFDRNRVRVQLTDAGRTFHQHVSKLLAQVDIAIASVRDTNRGHGGQLTICADWRLSINLIPESIAEFRTRYPHVDVVLKELHMSEQVSALRTRQAHIGFLLQEELVPRGDLESLLLIRSDLCVVVGPGHRLARRRQVPIATLRDEAWIKLNGDHGDGYRTYVTQICRLAGFAPAFAPQAASSLEALLSLVATGYGVGVLPAFMRPTSQPTLRFLRSDCRPIELCAVWPRDQQSVLLQHYVEILRRRVQAAGPHVRNASSMA
ncbi:MAG: LysR family transcriptional regulator [Verrucomicrobia bacterium]|nr:LysR family transcriptional regulator [Verrucomicrobiota bacterium]